MTDNISTGQVINSAAAAPKINLQVIILGIIALIAFLQAFQLIRINAKVNSSPVKTVAPASSGSGSQNNAVAPSEVPQSMVGGC